MINYLGSVQKIQLKFPSSTCAFSKSALLQHQVPLICDLFKTRLFSQQATCEMRQCSRRSCSETSYLTDDFALVNYGAYQIESNFC